MKQQPKEEEFETIPLEEADAEFVKNLLSDLKRLKEQVEELSRQIIQATANRDSMLGQFNALDYQRVKFGELLQKRYKLDPSARWDIDVEKGAMRRMKK